MRSTIRRSFCSTVLLALAACGGSSTEVVIALPPDYLGAPSVELAPDPFTPLAAELTVETDQPTRMTMTLGYEDGTTREFVEPGALETMHRIPVLGLRAGQSHRLELVATNASGLETPWAYPFHVLAGELPVDLPPYDVTVADTARMEPGFTLFNASGTDPVLGTSLSHISVFDEHGQIYWYHRSQHNITDLRRLRNGNLLFLYDTFGMREMDLTGRIVGDWWASNISPEPGPLEAVQVPLDTLHHEVFELPEGDEADFLLLSSLTHTVRDFPTDVADPTVTETASVVSDVIVTLKRDGTIVESWDLLHMLDPQRLCYDSLGNYWATAYGAGTRDWTHANASIYDPLHDEIIISCRHQEAVFAFGRSDGELRWILGDHDQWMVPWANHLLEPPLMVTSSEFRWPYHQHAPVLVGPDRIMLFDNGNNRAVPPALPMPGAPFSRAVEYEIDREAMTVTQTWAFGGPEDPWFSFAVGDADPLPVTNNVLITDGARMLEGVRWARVFQVDRSGQVVFEVRVQDPPSPTAFSWLIYRAEHLPSFP